MCMNTFFVNIELTHTHTLIIFTIRKTLIYNGSRLLLIA
jgi:hypothetical protein